VTTLHLDSAGVEREAACGAHTPGVLEVHSGENTPEGSSLGKGQMKITADPVFPPANETLTGGRL
jgi:hypothetical protein